MVKKRSPVSRAVEIFLVALTVITHWLVFYFIIINSFKSKTDASSLNLSLPKEWNIIENYTYIFEYANGAFFNAFINSVVLTFWSILILVLVSSTTAYIMQRRKGKFSMISDKLIVAGLIVPASIIPTYWVLSKLHIANTLTGLVMVEVATLFPFATMMYKGFIATLPRELDEAAIVDGCGALTLFFRIIFPLLKPITASVVILRSIVVYNDFQNPQYYMSGSSSQTVQLCIYGLKSAFDTDYGHLFAAIVVVSIPLVIVYIILNKQMMEGMTAGAVKG
ncbi:MAG TPA: carbohydrate ABC transporter permease [Candidatus Mediterraneibacter cottocaccae]|nr:carbohydrate ABC transporter permease [Candidatus Mediterraneibacter cottocaccae]